MNILIRSPLLLLILALLLTGCGETSEQQQEQEQTNETTAQTEESSTDAEYVEQAVFTDLEGEEVSISEFRGKVVMIDFWETWCKPCLASFPTLQQLQEEYPEDFIVLAVTPGFTDSREDAQKFAEENDYDFYYLMDSNGLNQDLGVQGIPFKVFVDANGEFITKEMGSFGADEDYNKVKEIIEENRES